MKTNKLFLAATLLILTSGAWASETSDTTPPTLASIAIAPTLVDTSTNSQSILLTVHLTDDLSGVAIAWALFRSPAGGFNIPMLSVPFFPSSRVSGDELDGVYTNTLVVPRFSYAGNWTLSQFDVTDAVGNHRHMSLAELRSLGFTTGFTVQGTDDRDPPKILSASISPTTVDISSSNQPIIITVHLRDELAGMGSYTAAQIDFISPFKGQRVFANLTAENRASGDQYDGVYTNTVWLPRYSEPGIWSLADLYLIDAAGNQQMIDLTTALNMGLPAEFIVEGTGDTSPPQIRALDFFPRRIDTSHSSQSIVVTARLLDDLSGIGIAEFMPFGNVFLGGYASATFLSPSKGQSADSSFNAWGRAYGSDFDGVYTNTMILPRFSETGVWTFHSFNLTDAAGNSSTLELADLRQLGFPTQFVVGIAPSLRITRQADSVLLSWPAWASNFSLQARGDIGPSNAWAPVGRAPVVFGDDAVVAVPLSASQTFYRLVEYP